MSNNNTAVTLLNTIGQDMTLTTADLVSAMVSKWETQLFNLKDELSDQIKQVKKDISTLSDKVQKQANDAYQHLIPAINPKLPIKVVIKANDPCWVVDKDHTQAYVPIRVEVSVTRLDNYAATANGQCMEYLIPHEDVELYTKLKSEQEQAESRLGQVLVEIKSVSRKERQLRGQLVETKFKELGFEQLLQDQQFSALIEVKI